MLRKLLDDDGKVLISVKEYVAQKKKSGQKDFTTSEAYIFLSKKYGEPTMIDDSGITLWSIPESELPENVDTIPIEKEDD